MKYLILFALVFTQSFAATYYVKYSTGSDKNAGTVNAPWKLSPQMKGWAGTYTPADGDEIVLMAGEVWPASCYPLIFRRSNVTLKGESGAMPKLDGGGQLIAGGMIQAIGLNGITISGIHVLNHGRAGDSGSSSPQAIDFFNCDRLTFSNLRLQTYSQRAIYIHSDTGGAKDDFKFLDIDVSNCASMLWFTSGSKPTTTHGFVMQGCYAHDFASQIGGYVHGDGFVHMFNVDSTWAVTGIDFSRNRVRGDFRRTFGTEGGMTAMFFVEGGKSTYSGNVYNNDFAPSPMDAQLFEAFFTISSGGSLNFYNNTLVNVGPKDNAATAGILINGQNGIYIVKNNIIAGFRYNVSVTTNTGNVYTFNNNLENASSGQNGTTQPPDPDGHFLYYDKWQAAPYFYDLKSLLGKSPIFVSTTDFSLKAGSPGIGAGEDLSNVFKNDFNGVPRTLPWDIGAYRFGTVPPPVVVPPIVVPPVVTPPVTTPSTAKFKSATISPDGKTLTITLE